MDKKKQNKKKNKQKKKKNKHASAYYFPITVSQTRFKNVKL